LVLSQNFLLDRYSNAAAVQGALALSTVAVMSPRLVLIVMVSLPVFGAFGPGVPTSLIWPPALASSGVQVQATVPGGAADGEAAVGLSSSPRLVTSQNATPAMTTTARAEPITACRWRRLRAAWARSAISFSSRARAAARCRSFIDDTVVLLLVICLA
jgi:hypothetical protein